MNPTLSIVVATGGQRPHLTTTTAATAQQLGHGDELIITRRDCAWGHEARNLTMPRCAGTHLMFIDDDDQHTPFALDTVRAALVDEPDRVHLFAMQYDDGRIVQPRWPLEMGYVSTQMLVVPNDPDLLGTWGERYEGDYDFITTTMQLRGDEPLLHGDVIALIGMPAPQRAVWHGSTRQKLLMADVAGAQ